MKISFETARLRLARLKLSAEESRGTAAATISKVSSTALQVDRAGLWLFHQHGSLLKNVALFDRASPHPEQGAVWSCAEIPSYLNALRVHRALAISDTQTSPVTAELFPVYLARLNVRARLDAPVIRGGSVIGVMSHEVLGKPRTWTQSDVDFAGAAADAVATMFETADRMELESALQRERETQLVQGKMVALERLSLGVLHELKNLLTVVALRTEQLKSKVERSGAESLAAISEAALRGHELTRQLSAFAELKIGEDVSDVVAVLGSLAPKLEKLKSDRLFALSIQAADPLRVRASIAELEQLIMNLFLNALDATTPGQQISIECRGKVVEGVPSAVLEVSDTGKGMSEDVQERIFEPYFTTKDGGTGFGLASVYGTVRRSGGSITVESAAKVGSTFRLVFPLAATAVPTADREWDYSSLPE